MTVFLGTGGEECLKDDAMPRDINIEVRIDTPHIRQRLLDPLTDTPRREILSPNWSATLFHVSVTEPARR